MYEGKGTLVFASGVVHKGEYKKGKYDGEGYIDYGKGSYFKGIFRNGSPSKGEYRYVDGAVYVGDFVNGELGGKGTLAFTNGNRYTGEFKNGTYHGQGEFKFLESVFTGEYRNGNPYFGTYKYNTGNEFTGFLHENWGRKVGEYRKEGAVYHGWFNEAGLYEGYGIQENEDGTKAEGEWLNGDNTGFTLMYIKALDKTVIGKLNYKGPGIWGVVSYKDKFYSGKMDDEGNMDYLEGNDKEHTRVYSEAMQYIRAGRKAYTDIMNKK